MKLAVIDAKDEYLLEFELSEWIKINNNCIIESISCSTSTGVYTDDYKNIISVINYHAFILYREELK